MLCAQLVGPETPYTTHDYEGIDAHAFRVFGVRDRESGDPLPVSERRELCAAYDLPQPRLLGRYETGEAVDGARRAIDELDAAGREGGDGLTDACHGLPGVVPTEQLRL